MKALTGLPTAAYVKVAEQVKAPLASLLNLIPALESGMLPAYVARYRPDISAGLDAEKLHDVLQSLRSAVDLEDRRITILTALGQKNELTPELRARIVAAERQDLEDIYYSFRAKRPTAADQALEQGLGPLADFLWNQDPPDADVEDAAQHYVDAEKGAADVRAALAGARHIVARRLGIDAEIRGELRRIAFTHAEMRVHGGESRRAEPALRKKVDWLEGYRSPVGQVGWRQHLALRRGVSKRLLRFELTLPENRSVSFMLERLLRDRSSLFCSHLGAAAYMAYHEYLAPALHHDVVHWLTDRTDAEALEFFKKNLRKTLLTPPAGPVPTIGLETGKPGGWRAVVVGADGNFLAAAIVHGDDRETERDAAAEAAPPSGESETSIKDVSAGREPLTGQTSDDGKTASAQENLVSGENPPAHPPPANGVEPVGEAFEPTGREDESPACEASGPENPRPAERAAESRAAVDGADDNAAGGDSAEPKSSSLAGASGSGAKRGLEDRSEADRAPKTPPGSLADLIREHNVQALVAPNGRGAPGSEKMIRAALRQGGAPNAIRTAVKEAGSWIYATSRAAQRELPGVEPAVRSAVSLARRFQDPLVEFVKHDPKLLGIGPFCGEIEPGKLRKALRQTVKDCVHEVGVDLNTASRELLGHLPGITDRLAKRIVEYRDKEGRFSSRAQLKHVPGMSDRLYKQAVGFARVNGGEQPLDATGVHPDWRPVVEKIVAAAGVSIEEALEKPEVLASVHLEEWETKESPRPILGAVARELARGKSDPRRKFKAPEPAVKLLGAEQLKAGLEIEGLVTNITHFGAFVDIGADQDGLVRLSHMADKFRENGHLAVKAGDRLKVRVLAVENDGGRISLTTRDPGEIGRGPRNRKRGPGNGSARTDRPLGRAKGIDRGKQAPKRSSGADRKVQASEAKYLKKLTLDEKLALLETKYRTKI